MRPSITLGLLALAACVHPPKVVYVDATARNANVVPFDGAITEKLTYHVQHVHTGAEVGVAVDSHPASALLADRGLTLATGLICGDNVRVLASTGELVYGRLLVFAADPKGTGPAGHGDYYLNVPDERIAETAGGRTALAYESYRTTLGDERYAWIVWLAAQPIACGDDHPVAPAGAAIGGATFTLTSSGATPQRRVAYRPVAGTRQQVEIAIDGTTTQGSAAVVSPTIVIAADLVVDAVAADGTITATLTFVDVTARDAAGSAKGAATKAASDLASAKGVTFAITVTATGRIAVTSTDPEASSFTGFLGTMVVPLPDQPIGDGATWRTTSHQTEGGLAVDEATEYTLAGAHVTGAVTVTAPSQTVTSQGTSVEVTGIQGSGSLDADLDPTLLVSRVTFQVSQTTSLRVSGREVQSTSEYTLAFTGHR